MEKPCNLIQRGIIDSIVSFSIIWILHCISHVCVCEIFDLVFTFKMKHPVREHLCMYTWLARDSFPELEFAFLLSFPSTMPTFTVNLVSLEWRVRVPRSIHARNVYMNVQGQNEMDLPFRFDFSQKSCFPALPPPSRIEVNVLKRKFIFLSFFFKYHLEFV